MTVALTDLADRVEIIELVGRYNRAFDEADAEGWAGTFTEEGVLNSAFSGATKGREALAAMCRELAGQPGVGHVVTTDFMVEVAEDRASHTCTGIILNGPGGRDIVGRYTDELARTPEGWRFQQRTYLPLSMAAPATSGQ